MTGLTLLSVTMIISSSPHMEPTGAHRLAELVERCAVFIEFGSGGSTMLAGEKGVPAVISTESDLAFCEQVRTQFCKTYLRSTLVSIYADIGPTKAWGHPVDDRKKHLWPLYASKAWRFASEHGHSPDLVLVDGRFRLACTLLSLLLAKPGTPILLDDYVGRTYATVLERFLLPTTLHGRMAEFHVPEDRDALMAPMVLALAESILDPA